MTPSPLRFAFALTACLLASTASAQTAQSAGIPKVVFSAKHKAMCKVGVGDALPTKVQAGKTATVVAFVKGNGWMTRQLLTDLKPDVVDVFGKQGVSTQAVITGPANRKAMGFPVLADADGKMFEQVGSDGRPRVYVLDAEGKIVWFDIEYSRSTRRELRQTLEVLAGKAK